MASADKQAVKNAATWIGPCVSLFSMLVIRQVFHTISPEADTALAVQ